MITVSASRFEIMQRNHRFKAWNNAQRNLHHCDFHHYFKPWQVQPLVVEKMNAIEGVTCETPKGAFYAFPNITKTGWKSKELASALLEETGVATIGGPDFGILGEGYIRLSYANSEENIERAIERIKIFLEQ